MSETKKAGVVTELYVWSARCFNESKEASPLMLRQALEDVGELGCLPALDLVASWPEELRAVVPLIAALTPEGKSILPDVLRAMAKHPGDCAVLEAGLGEPVSTSAKVAAWAGEFDAAELKLLAAALNDARLAHLERGLPGEAERLAVMLDGLEAATGAPLDANAARILASRTPRPQLKGTFPPVAAGQIRCAPCSGHSRVVEVDLATKRGAVVELTATGLKTRWPLELVESWPLSEDFEPSTAKLEPRVWKAGTVPPVVLPGMVFENGSIAGEDSRQKTLGVHFRMVRLDGTYWYEATSRVLTWRLAEDFPVPEDFAC